MLEKLGLRGFWIPVISQAVVIVFCLGSKLVSSERYVSDVSTVSKLLFKGTSSHEEDLALDANTIILQGKVLGLPCLVTRRWRRLVMVATAVAPSMHPDVIQIKGASRVALAGLRDFYTL